MKNAFNMFIDRLDKLWKKSELENMTIETA